MRDLRVYHVVGEKAQGKEHNICSPGNLGSNPDSAFGEFTFCNFKQIIQPSLDFLLFSC